MASRVGIDLGGTKIEAVLMGDDGEIVHRERAQTPSDYIHTIKAIHEIAKKCDAVAGEILPVGIGTPGAWNASRGQMKNCNSTCLNGKPFLDDLQKVLARPVRIENDANCFALSEAVDGAGADKDCVFGVILGTGVGGGWVLNKQLLTGANHLAGEWGHNPMPYVRQDARTYDLEKKLSDRVCYCGRTNCVETFLSGPGLAATYRDLTGREARGESLSEREDAKPALDLYVSMLARALAVVVNVIDPDAIIFGGGVSNLDHIYSELPRRMQEYSFSSEGETVVRRAQHGDASGVRGAAWLFPG